MKKNKQLGLIILLCFSVFGSAANAESFRARIVKIEGHVYVVNSEGEQRKPQKKQYLVNSNETIITRKDSKAIIQFDDGAMSVLDEKSSLRVEKSGWLSQLGGKVYYVFRKVFGKNKPRKVKTKFATIGIRGTTFIVDMSAETQKVALQEGRLNIESVGEYYKIIKKSEKEDGFLNYKLQVEQERQQMNEEFEEYKENIKDEFIEYKKSFDLYENRVVTLHDNVVEEQEMDRDWESSFEYFSEFSKDYVGAYRELDKL